MTATALCGPYTFHNRGSINHSGNINQSALRELLTSLTADSTRAQGSRPGYKREKQLRVLGSLESFA